MIERDTLASPERRGVLRLAKRLADSVIARNAAALYGLQFCRKIFPLISIPYLARVLGPAGLGTVAFVQSLSEFLVLWIEFGFNLSATRDIAHHRDSPEECGRIATGVLGAQILLAASGTLLAVTLYWQIPALRENPKLLGAGLVYAIAQGLVPLWFFQGLERLTSASILEITGKALALAGIFMFVHGSPDNWKVLGLQAIPPAITVVAGLWMARRSIRLCEPKWELVADALRSGWRMFVFRSGESLYGVGNAFILGLFAPAAMVGYFAGAEKLSRAAGGLLNPIKDAIFPRIVTLTREAPERAARLLRIGAVLMVTTGALLTATLFLGAPMLVFRVMGPQFGAAVNVVRIMSVLPLLLSITNSVGLQSLLPMRRDREVNAIILSAGGINVFLAILFAPHWAHAGMAWAVVIAETFVCVSMVAAARRKPLFAAKAVVPYATAPGEL